jgi:gamma-glutamylcyclotransferase (GGCT)/AIG2-like uncharacterized protein YtfP
MSADLPVFAYGSNLSRAEIAGWFAARGLDAAEHCRPVGTAMLPDHALSFGYRSERRGGGALDVRPCRGSVVNGVLLAVSAEGAAALDEKEGVAAGAYARRVTEVIRPGGALRDALVYVVTEASRREHQVPADGYVDTVATGYAQWGFDPAPLLAVAGGGSGAVPVDAVFVYGTLLRGESNAQVLHGEAVRRVADAVLHGATLHETGEPYPVMRLAGAGPVHGELAELEDIATALGPLDRLETFTGYGRRDRAYHRTLVTVRAEGEDRLAWTYVAGERLAPGAPIASGDWRRHRARR